MPDMHVYDSRPCELGEGPLWHPLLETLFWFDIQHCRLLSRKGEETREWRFNRHVSAAGWLDETSLLVASETDLFRLDLESGRETRLIPLESDNPLTRSNDGRADPYGGFWIGTMSKSGQEKAGALYRYYRNELRCLARGLTTPNSICFSPDGIWAYFSDTRQRLIFRQRLESKHGWPVAPAEIFIDLRIPGFKPDGAVTDQEGCIWNAQWGASRIARYSPEGEHLEIFSLPVEQPSCPAFGGKDHRMLFITSARQKLTPSQLTRQILAGQTFCLPGAGQGQVASQLIF